MRLPSARIVCPRYVFKQMLGNVQLCYIKHNIRTFRINDISYNSETITLQSTKNTIIKLYKY